MLYLFAALLELGTNWIVRNWIVRIILKHYLDFRINPLILVEPPNSAAPPVLQPTKAVPKAKAMARPTKTTLVQPQKSTQASSHGRGRNTKSKHACKVEDQTHMLEGNIDNLVKEPVEASPAAAPSLCHSGLSQHSRVAPPPS